MSKKFKKDFYIKDALDIAPLLIGKTLVRKLPNGELIKKIITEIEVYRGEEDTACHARAGKTDRTKVLYEEGGISYVYLCYGVHYLLNIVTGQLNQPQAILIRCIQDYNGPGKLTKFLNITKELNYVSFYDSDQIWIEDDGIKYEYITDKRVGIDYATEYYKNIKWRYILKNKN